MTTVWRLLGALALFACLFVGVLAAPAVWRRVRRHPRLRPLRRDVALLADRPAKWGRRS